MLTLTESYLHFSEAFIVDKQLERDNSLTGVFGCFLEFTYLTALQQQFAITFGLMVGIRPKAVLGNMHLLDVHLSVLYGTIGIDQRSFPLADRFDFRAEQLNTGRIAIKNDILKLRFLVENPYVAL